VFTVRKDGLSGFERLQHGLKETSQRLRRDSIHPQHRIHPAASIMPQKRNASAGPMGEPPKRRRTQHVVHEPPTSEEVHTARQLEKLLTPDGDLKKARHGLQSFKVLLDAIANSKDEDGEKAGILESYLEGVKPKGGGGDSVYLPDIMELWAQAVQHNEDNVMSAAAVVLALLLRIISTRLHLLPSGVGIGRTLLQPRQRDLIAKNLSIDKSKEFVISPTLRLVREILTLDGGALAGAIFRARSQTFAGLARNLGIRHLGDGVESTARPSARTTAVRFVLSALRFGHREAKREILAQRELVAGITRFVKDDPPHLVPEILEGLKRDVLLDESLPRDAKGRLLSLPTLNRIAGLYGYDQQPSDKSEVADEVVSIPNLAHDFLLTACTNFHCGILRKQTGFYPKGSLIEKMAGQDTMEDAMELSGPRSTRSEDDVPVHNTVLSEFVQSLRPWSSILQSELVVAIFRAAPELVAKFFLDKRGFSFEPKLSSTWIGYSAFLFATIQLPTPPSFGREAGYFSLPPPTSIVLDNILPGSLDQKALTKCFTTKSTLTTFIAARLLILALEKLQTVLNMYDESIAKQSATWQDGRRELLHQTIQRLPAIKEVTIAYRSAPLDDLLHREMLSRLLRLYFEVVPEIALMYKFDVAPILMKAMEQTRNARFRGQDRALSVVELENLLAVASRSPSMRWFATVTGAEVTPFTALLRICVDGQLGADLTEIDALLGSLAMDYQLVVPDPGAGRYSPYLSALKTMLQSDPDMNLGLVYQLLGKSAALCAASPLKYLDIISDSLANQRADDATDNVDPILAAIDEQLPFVLKDASASAVDGLYRYFVDLANGLGRDPASKPAMQVIFAQLESHFRNTSPSRPSLSLVVEQATATRSVDMQDAEAPTGKEHLMLPIDAAGDCEPSVRVDAVLNLIQSQPDTSLDNAALTRWISKSVDELLDDGHVATLVRLLASEHQSIRKQAQTNMVKVANKIRESDYDEKTQVWLLLMEAAESAKEAISAAPLPWTIVSYTTHALDVLQDPLHDLYAKVNKFLLKGPSWMLDRLPLVQKILLDEPEGDDSWYRELSWLLQYLLDGLQTPVEVKIFHDRRTFEQLCSLASNPYLRSDLKMQVFRILWRTTCLDGGSTTLITRFGILSWLEAVKSSSIDQERDVCAVLLKQVWETCDQTRVREWSQGGMWDWTEAT
jgi:nucleolar pre-ribosomal-associated protein 1